MPAPVNPEQMVRVLLQSLQRGDREAIVLNLVELGLWVSVTPDPLPLLDVCILSHAALTVTLSELRSTIEQHRDLSATILERDSSSIAAIIERNTEMMESVAKALSTLTPSRGFLMVGG